MKKVIPFKKDILFKTNISEIVSISLENDLKFSSNDVIGNLSISGQYKMNDTSINTEYFNYDLPVEINIDDKYNIDKAIIDIDDFYYEIINNNTLSVHIEILIDKLEEVLIIPSEDIKEEIIEEPVIIEERCIEDEANTLFKYTDEKELYSTYRIYIVREGDTIDTIIGKYGIDRESLDMYNDLKELKIGDKLIIPSNVKN